ncbi:uncharacterized protein DEA37_0001578 [Paragonimus westermani]|uniref:C2H2-type domain-containing protein n=1 Tax=Paragonimus westermani TaxID=34504 RepID=A0A5J4NFS7_9TREM|nr:uncharacterized protein DEA37_0001578 [Paragonimus westermani]
MKTNDWASLLISLSWLLVCQCTSAIKNDVSAHTCSRSESRLARNVLRELVFPLYQFSGVSIPDGCPWNPRLDMYRAQEGMKLQNSAFDWQCKRCGKRFYYEDALDMHFQRKYASTLVTGANAVCLATWCPVLRCHVLYPDLALGSQSFWDEALCEEAQFVSLRAQCEEMLEKCGAGIQSPNQDLRDWLQTAICSHLNCSRYWEIPDQRVSMSTTSVIFFTLLCLLCLFIYLLVLFSRFSVSPSSLRASSLSSPYYFQSVSRAEEMNRTPFSTPKIRQSRVKNY